MSGSNDVRLSRRSVLGGLTVLGAGAGISATLIGCQELPSGLSQGRATATVASRPAAVAPGVTLVTFRAPAGHSVLDVVWSPDSQRLAYCTDGDIPDLRVCDLAARKTVLLYQDDTVDLIHVLSWFSSGTGQLSYLGVRAGPLQVLDPASGNTQALYDVFSDTGPGAFANVYVFAWSPDGKRVAVASEYCVTIREGVSGRVLVTYPTNPPPGGQPSYIVAWSPDGKTIASAGRTHAVQFWEAATGRPLHYFPELAHAIAAAWSPDGRYLAYMVGQSLLTITNAGKLQPVQTIVREVSSAREALSLSGHFLAGGGQVGPVIYPHSLAWSPDSRYLATAGQGAEVQVWEVARRRLILSYSGHRDTVLAVAWSPDGRYIASAGVDGTVQVWEAPGR
uniref:Uncharacterized protein n=1 Tax=Thermogemmatispora argillosa TaxID=2045280 RepID=A0A455SZS3_9CHLR|nr:hypothetical protein KTA_06110 [Thermogemmatispora argillosa]